MVELIGLQGRETAEREVRDVGNALGGEGIEELVVLAVGDVVEILDANDIGDLAGFRELRGGDVAEADVADESLLLEFGESGERGFDGAFGRSHGRADPEVCDINPIEAEVSKIVVGAIDEFLWRGGGDPGGIGKAPEAEFCHDHEAGGVGVERLPDDLVGDVGAVEIAGIDVIHAGGDGFAQDGKGGVAVAGRPEDMGPGELHGTVAHAVDGELGARNGEGTAEVGGSSVGRHQEYG